MSVSEKFNHDGNEFEIRIETIIDRHCVKVFLNGDIVSPTYSVNFETHADYFAQHQANVIDNLKAIAKSDIEQGLYFKA
jgi:hypothetical protein